jgi:predicted site-specific integrase-resolvase
MNEEQYVTVAQACDMLRISVFKLSRMIRDGDLEAVPDQFDKRRKLIKLSSVKKMMRKPRLSYALAS